MIPCRSRPAPALLLGFAVLAAGASAQSFDVVPSPNPGSRGNFLYGAAGVSENEVWAFGLYRVPGVPSVTDDSFPLALRWDGDSWSVDPLPSLPAPPNGSAAELYGAAAFPDGSVWAVGGAKPQDDLQRPQTLVFRRNASGWQRVPSPVAVPNDGGSYFNDIDGVASDDLWAVGNENGQFLAAHYDGAGWTEHPVPPGALKDQELRALSVIASDDVWAVGGSGETFVEPVIVHWDGSSWGNPIPNPPMDDFNGLWDVIAFAPDDMWVAANSTDVPPAQRFVHWDGDSWDAYPAPQFHSARFVGTSDNLYSVGYNEIMRWTGQAWVEAAALDPAQPFGGFNDAVQLADGTIWGVGRTTAGDQAATLTARFRPCPAADLTGDCSVNFFDLSALIALLGPCQDPADCPGDLNGDGTVNFFDLQTMLDNLS